MSLASKVLVGLVLGIATGIALGEWAGALAVVGRAPDALLALLGGFLLAGRASISWRRTIPFVAASVALLVGTVAGARLFFTTAVEGSYTGYRKFVERDLLREPVSVTLRDASPELSPADGMPGQRLARIQARGHLRVGYFDDALPFAFRNARGEVTLS